MSRTKSKKFGKAIGAIFLPFFMLPLMTVAQTAEDDSKEQPRPRMRMLARDLFDITPEQEKKLEEFRKARMEEGKAFREEMSKMRGELRELGKDPEANAAKIDDLIDRMFKLRADRAKAAVRSRPEREKIFTPEQLEKMKKYRGAFFGRSRFAERGRMAFGRGFRGWGRPWMRHRGMILRRHLFQRYWW
ncbi:MAG: Spy/CpxP family protein refolding chaperone [Acidobacteriota bacterium]